MVDNVVVIEHAVFAEKYDPRRARMLELSVRVAMLCSKLALLIYIYIYIYFDSFLGTSRMLEIVRWV